MQITFPLISTIDSSTGMVAFPADVGGTRLRCLVSTEALQDHCQGIGVDPVEAFEANRERIELIASEKINSGQTGTILIKTADF